MASDRALETNTGGVLILLASNDSDRRDGVEAEWERESNDI